MESMIYRRKVNYYETDQMSIVHHSNYIRYFEEARLEMLDQLDLNYARMEQNGLIIPVLFVDCKYLQPLLYGDTFDLHLRITKYDGIKMELSYEIYKEDGKVLCTTGCSGHCFLDKEMKPVRMKREYPEIYQKLKALVQAE
ncbi:MAG: thioesterase family protein [Eubacteriales bacterium]|nr:thioesterase family protein [Eubacteriales bacterium]